MTDGNTEKIQSRDILYLFNVPRSMNSEIFFPDVNPKSLPACKCSGSSRDRKASEAVSCSSPRKSSVWKAREWLISLLHRMSPPKFWAASTRINGHLAVKVSTVRTNNQQKPLENVLGEPSSN